MSIQVVSRLAQRGWEVTPRQLFERPTVRGLAAVAVRGAGRSSWRAPTGPLVTLTAAERAALPVAEAELAELYPAAPMQAGLVLHTLLEPGSGIYLMQNRHRIEGALDLARFDPAWTEVVARHEALRGLEPEAQALRAEPALQAELDQGLDLTRGPLFRVRLFRLAEARFEMVVSYHHAILDAWCVFLLLSEFALAYRALEQGRALPPPAPPYRDFIAWLLARDLRLDGCREPSRAVARPRGAVDEAGRALIGVPIPPLAYGLGCDAGSGGDRCHGPAASQASDHQQSTAGCGFGILADVHPAAPQQGLRARQPQTSSSAPGGQPP